MKLKITIFLCFVFLLSACSGQTSSLSSSKSGSFVTSDSEQNLKDGAPSVEASPTAAPTEEPSLVAEVGKEYTDLSFLTQEQQTVYCRAEDLADALFGLEANLQCLKLSPAFQPQVDGIFVRTVGGYSLYENTYKEFQKLIYGIFTPAYIDSLGAFYTEKFVDYDGYLATLGTRDSLMPLKDDLANTVLDNCPDAYRLEFQTKDAVCFTLISHYDRNWSTSMTIEEMDVYTIEYPICMVNTEKGWRIDEFHTTIYG